MTTGNLIAKGLRIRRGNTAVTSEYTGPIGELILDTDLDTIRVQDGLTSGGHVLAGQEWVQDYVANVALANIDLSGYATTAEITSANSAILVLQANAALQASLIDTLTGNAATQGGVLVDLVSNAATQASSLSTLTANAAVQAVSLTDLIANAAVQAEAIANASVLTGWAVDVNNHFVPNTDNIQDIGTPTQRVRHIYVGPGSITVGSSVITESTTGKLVLPGITRGVNYTIDEVEEKGNQTYTFSSTPVIIDAAYYDILQGVLSAPVGYQAPEYAVDEMDDGEIDGIDIVSGGAGLDQTVAAKMRDKMRAYVGSDLDPINNFQAIDWIQIPFTVSTEAADVEYEFGGSADLGNFSIDDEVLEAESATIRTTDGDLTLDSDSDVFVKTSGNEYTWTFSNSGDLTLPEGGTIYNSQGQEIGVGSGNLERLAFSAGEGEELVQHDAGFGNESANDFEIRLNAHESSENQIIWGFKTDGSLTIPNAIVGSGDNDLTIQNTSSGFAYLDLPADSGANPVILANQDTNGTVKIRTGEFEVAEKDWEFDNRGVLRLPEGGDIVNSSGQSVLGSGSNSYTPDDEDNWDTVPATVQAALDELAIKVAALQNFEIDGGNAYTPAAGELLIDGNGA